MKTLTKKQNQVLGGLTISKNSNGYKSLIECLTNGTSRTGISSYSKGWARKSEWSAQVTTYLTQLGIEHACSNDAPNGGANGSFVAITDKKHLNRIKRNNAVVAEEKRLMQIKEAAEKSQRIENANKIIAGLPSNEAFENKWNNQELKDASGLSWTGYRQYLKNEYPNDWSILKIKFTTQQNARN